MILFNKILDATKTFVSSDWHLNHRNILRCLSSWTDVSGCRGDFSSLDEMNNHIINKTNEVVGESDCLINLGDIIFGNKRLLESFVTRLRCQNHHYIIGNHDHWMISDEGEFKQEVSRLFKSMQFYLEVFARMPDGSKHKICFNHFSGRVWHDSHKRSILLYGHSHGSIDDYGRSIDVGVDTKNWRDSPIYAPYRLSDIITNLQSREVVTVDHHV